MLDRTNHNPREVIGGNLPPGALEFAKPVISELGVFLKENPVIGNEDEAREGKALKDRVDRTLAAVEEERDGKVRPLNTQVATINAAYHVFHNTNKNRPGLWDTHLRELVIRLTSFTRKEEARRRAEAEEARALAAAAEREAREAEERERQAAEDASMGVCVDTAAATEAANIAFTAFSRASREAKRAERDTKVRIGGGIGRVLTLRETEILTVTNWRAAIEDIGLTQDIADAILKGARAYRKENGELPAGIARETERSV